MSPNINCLEGVKCPSCGNEETFRIQVTTMATVTDDGAEVEHGDMDWDDVCYVECASCHEYGKLSRFKAQSERPHRLPPRCAPHVTNTMRASWAEASLYLLTQLTGCDREDALGDLLCDLMHWAALNDFDMDAALDRARGHFEAERFEEMEAANG